MVQPPLMYRKIAEKLQVKTEWTPKEFRQHVGRSFGIKRQESTKLLLELKGYKLVTTKNKRIVIVQAPEPRKPGIDLRLDPNGLLGRMLK